MINLIERTDGKLDIIIDGQRFAGYENMQQVEDVIRALTGQVNPGPKADSKVYWWTAN